jgi:histidine kinase/DNA gyrase B/HSP90-like ATPase
MTSKSMTAIKVLPSASRLVYSLRDLGYDFPQAVADVIDNSVAAGATLVRIDLRFDGRESWLRIADNGLGMDRDAATEAMRYGAKQSYEEDALGKFGLGLKTASLSQCRKLSVASRNSHGRARIEVRKLDLDHVLGSNRWEIFELDPNRCDERLTEPLRDGSGTVVLWQSLDRVLGYRLPSGKRARSAIDALAEQLDLHLGMIFHRFLSGEVEGRRRLRIKVNGRSLAPWDPFARDEPATERLPGSDIDVVTPDAVGLARFQPFVLPPRERFSSEEAFHRYSGPRKWNAQQGFYIYRANRMIQSGGWCRMRALDEHVKLARASIDFYPGLDAAFEINVAKVRAVLPTELRERLRAPVECLVRAAQAAYRAHPGGDTAREQTQRRKPQKGSNATARPALESAARKAGELPSLRRIVRHLRMSDPRLAEHLGW